MTRTLIVLASLILLSGCAARIENAIKSDRPVASTYALHAGVPQETKAVPASTVLLVARPVMPAGFNTPRIVLMTQGGRQMDYYAGAQWPDTLEVVLGNVIIETARNTFPGLIVDNPAISIPSSFRLATTVNEFQPVYANGPDVAPLVRAGMTFTLIRMPDEKVIDSFTFNAERPAPANSVTAITRELEIALQGILEQANTRIAPALTKKPASQTKK